MSIARGLSWLLLTAALVAVILWRFQPAYTLDVFLPEPETAGEKVLVERFGQGPAASWMMIRIGGDTPVQTARQLRDKLLATDLFLRVDNGEQVDLNVPEPVWTWRYLLTDRDWSAQALQQDLENRLADLGMGGGAEIRSLIQADPGFDAIAVLQQLESPTAPPTIPWQTTDGDALLVAETRASAFDADGQQQAVDRVHALMPTEDYLLTGSGTFTARLSATIRSEATFRSILASLAIFLVLLLAYRSLRLTLLAALPLGIGVLAGLAAVSLVFAEVHGITLAFGFTLIGIAIDFPLHLFSHARGTEPRAALRSVWPTLLLGGISTVLAYLALVASGSSGLAQLGLFAAAGVTAAVLVTRELLPWLLPQPESYAPDNEQKTPPRLRAWPALLVGVIAGGVMLAQSPIWNPSLAALSPVPESWLQDNNELRAALGAPDLRYLAVVRDADRQAVLSAAERSEALLSELKDDGIIAGWQNATILLPSQARQQQRQRAIPEPDSLESSLDTALQTLPFRSDAFAPFVQATTASRSLPVVSLEDYANSPLKSALANLFYQAGDVWVGLTQFYGVTDAAALEAALADSSLTFVDFKNASDALVSRYRVRALSLLGGALVLIAAFLAWQVGLGRRWLWVLATVSGGVLSAAAIGLLVDGSLNLFHLIALILVAGLSLDYALFLSRPDGGSRDTRHAVTACVASTTLAFGVLALSEIPMLHWLGLTVAAGALIAYCIARLSSLSLNQ